MPLTSRGLAVSWGESKNNTINKPKTLTMTKLNKEILNPQLRQTAVSCSADRILWLDDLRNPFINIEGRVPKENLIIDWVLNYEQFVQWIEKYGLPQIISFDHDLADEHYTPEEYWHDYQISKEYQEAQNYQEKTGMDCAKWLIDYCIDNKKPLPIFYVHSANPVGADNINGILNNYLKHCS